mmetsp:Transcript_1619/g.2217  ORF Transcript_1619/g.2217 Transcript_1619/m.2217 type:complete len:640 (-) Transcript_1619:425-2344(-)
MGSAASLVGNVSNSTKRELLQHSPIFRHLNEQQLRGLAQCFSATYRKAQSKIENLPQLVYIGEGEVDVFTAIPDKNQNMSEKQFVCTKAKGDIIIPFAKSQSSRKASRGRRGGGVVTSGFVEAICRTDCLVLSMKAGGLESLAKKDVELALLLTKLNEDIASYTRNLAFLQEADQKQLKLFADLCNYQSFAPGEVVINEGEIGDVFYLILHGVCDVKIGSKVPADCDKPCRSPEKKANSTKNLRRISSIGSPQVQTKGGIGSALRRASSFGGRESFQSNTGGSTVTVNPKNDGIIVASLKEGQYFGETALMVNIPRTCTIVCSEACLFACIDKDSFGRFLKFCPRVRKGMEQVMCERILDMARAMGIPLLGAFPTFQVTTSELAEKCRLHQFNSGELVCKEGEEVQGAFINVYGEVHLIKENRAVFRRGTYTKTDDAGKIKLTRSKSFGEETFNSPKIQYTVVAAKDTVLLEVTKEAEKLIHENKDLLALFQVCTLMEDCNLEQIINEKTGFKYLFRFLQAEHTEENAEFIQKVKDYKDTFDDFNSRPPMDQAIDIINTFIKESSSKQVNITSDMRTNLEEKIKRLTTEGSSVITVDMFDEAYNEIMKLVDRDCFQRFKRSNSFQDLMKHYKESAGPKY